METFRSGNIPGFTTNKETVESEVRAAVEGGHNPVVVVKAMIDSTAVDAGNTPTTTLRGGLILGKKASDGNAYQYDADATDGTQCPVGILPVAQTMLRDGVATDVFGRALIHGVVKESELIGLTAAVKAVFARVGIRVIPTGDPFDVDGAAFLIAPRKRQMHATDYTVKVADSGDLLIASAAANFTLPTIAHGLTYEFLQSADANMVITGSNNIVAMGDAAASTLTFSTTSEKIGAHVRLRAEYVGTTLLWITETLSAATMTIA